MFKSSWQMGKTPYESQFGEALKRPVIPFGTTVEYCPISAREKSWLHQFGKKVLRGIFLGNALIVGGIWKGDLLVADIEEFENIDASEIHPRRINKKEVSTSQTGKDFIFPVAEGTAKLSGRDHEFRESTVTQEQPVGSEDLSGEQGEPEDFNRQNQKMTLGSGKTFGLFKMNSSIVITLNLEFNPECKMKKPSLFHWNTLTWPEHLIQIWMCCKKKTYWRLLECGRESKSIRFLERIHKVHFIERKSFKGINVIKTESNKNSRNYKNWGSVTWSLVQKSKRKKRSRMGKREAKTRQWWWFLDGNTLAPAFRKLKRRVVNPTRFQRQSIHRGDLWVHKTTFGIISFERSWRSHRRQRIQLDDTLQLGVQVYSYTWSDEKCGCESSSGQGMEEVRNDSSVTVG